MWTLKCMKINHNSVSVFETRFLLIKVFLQYFIICTPCFRYSLMFYMYVYAIQVGVLKLYLPVVMSHIVLPSLVPYPVYVYILTQCCGHA